MISRRTLTKGKNKMIVFRLKMLFLFAISFLIVRCGGYDNQQAEKNTLTLWYKQPAEKWVEALPVGNGRLSAMVFGRIDQEIIQLNEESLWAGSQINNNNPETAKHINEIRKLLLEEKNDRAFKLAEKYMLGTPPRIRSYQTLGDLYLDFPHNKDSVENYKRGLDLSDGLSSVQYKCNDILYKREVFISAMDNVIVVHLSADKNARINFTLSLKRTKDALTKSISNNMLLMDGQIVDDENPLSGPAGAHMKFSTKLKVLNEGGNVSAEDDKLCVKNADEVTIVITAATDYNLDNLNFDRSIKPEVVCDDIIDKALLHNYKALKDRHIADHSVMFNRVAIDLGKTPFDNLPTDERLRKVKDGAVDNGLLALYFQYGRYLLMDSSRLPGILPANLQGIWNKDFNAPWNADFHTNINLQMNYWLADMCNLSETVLPLTNFFYHLMRPGSLTAREMYNARGWTMHHLTDPFGRTGLMDGVGWGTSPLAGSWMALTFWRHYQYNLDKKYLQDKAYPILKGSAQFVLDFLMEDGNGYLVTAPSVSPENFYIHPKTGKKTGFTYAATIDIEIINELFNSAIKAGKVLNTDAEFAEQLQRTLKKLPPLQIGKDGTIMEWIKDYEEVDPGHRHMSHLFALHPGTQITPDTPQLLEAARKTIDKRLSSGGGHTGWSRAWIVNFYARLSDGENAYKHLLELLRKSTLSNLFDSHPPFQIDGNFGGTSGIAEMLLQSHNDLIRILPALPDEWQDGFVKGLKARGDFTVDIYWSKGTLTKLVIKSGSGSICNIRYKNKTIKVETETRKEYIFNTDLGLLE